MNVKWIFKDGETAVECTSFPYAFRAMHNAFMKGIESGKRKYGDMVNQMAIVSPHRNRGDLQIYSYSKATEMARAQGLLLSDGQLNKKEFRRL
jgi:hypothetical protein